IKFVIFQTKCLDKGLSLFTIEHILPDAECEENANIGNLLPLEHKLNEKCGILPLKNKFEFYKKSEFKSVRKFVERYEKEPEKFSIEKRREYLSEDFYKMISE
ncbi:MAG: DUF1524 domain-containing protein, partial [Spirochaetales bacterium]|nr:DUF1524 domain-containing protein [Spirochaetales bacterium]